MAGIITVVGFYVGDVKYIILSTVMITLFVLTFTLKLIFVKKHIKFKLISIVVAFIVSIGLTVGYIEIHNSKREYAGEYYIEGVVASGTYKSGTSVVFTIDSANVVNMKTLEKSKVKGKIRFYLGEQDGRTFDMKLGEKVEITANLSSVKLFKDGRINFSMFNRGIYVLGYGEEESVISKNEFSQSLADRFKLSTKEKLDTYLSSEYSELAYTMLFGDKSGLSDEITDNYTASGIAHLLAVSGLHVGFVVVILNLILSLCKANKKVKFWAISIVVFFYAMLCGFSVSVTRAFIMTVVMLYCNMRHHEYDGLSSLSLAGIIILLINPLWVFDIGFKLSFGAVAGIMLFSPIIKDFCSKFLLDKLASSLAISLGATIGTLPSMMINFTKLSIFSVVTNLIVIPIASFAFMLLFVIVLISFIIPPLLKFVYLFEALMKIVSGVSVLTGAINLAKVNKWLIYGFSAGLITSGMLVSYNLILPSKAKKVSSISLSILTILMLALMFI